MVRTILLLPCGLALAFAQNPGPPTAVTVDGQPVAASAVNAPSAVTTQSTTSAIITLTSSSAPAHAAVVLVDPLGAYLNSYLATTTGSTSTVRLSDLRPNRDYRFAVIYGDAANKPYNYQGKYYHFKTASIDKTAPTAYRIDFNTQPGAAYAGGSIYVQAFTALLGGPTPLKSGALWIQLEDSGVSISPVMPGFAAHWTCGPEQPLVTGDKQHGCLLALDPGNWSRVPTLRLDIPANATPGAYTITATTAPQTGPAVPLSFPLTVKSPLSTIRDRQPTAPPIPGLRKWKTLMKVNANKFCKPDETMYFGVESQVWYYDGVRTFIHATDHFKSAANPKWMQCAQNIAAQYEKYVLDNKGGIPSYRHYSTGLAMLAMRGTDPKGAIAVHALAGAANGLVSLSIGYQREAALEMDDLISDARLTGIEPPLLRTYAGIVISHLSHIEHAPLTNFSQPAFDGLSMEALIRYYEYTSDLGAADARIPGVIRDHLEWIWNNATVLDTASRQYGWMPLQASAFHFWTGIQVPNTCIGVYAGLDNLVAPAAAWLWNLTQDDVWLQRGDVWFSHALDEENLNAGSWNGKQSSQIAHWSYDYVWYRSNTHPVRSLNDPLYNKP
jgi:hypothetical protein